MVTYIQPSGSREGDWFARFGWSQSPAVCPPQLLVPTRSFHEPQCSGGQLHSEEFLKANGVKMTKACKSPFLATLNDQPETYLDDSLTRI